MDGIERALQTLGLGPDATPEAIKQAYRDLAMVWHPDRFPQDSRVQRKAEENLKRINEAYSILQGYDHSPRVRSAPYGGTWVRTDQARDRPGARAATQGSPAPECRNRVPPWAYIIGSILAICLAGYLMEAPKPAHRPGPSFPAYDPGTGAPGQPGSSASGGAGTRGPTSPSAGLRPDGANPGESGSREGGPDLGASGSPDSRGLEQSAPSSVVPAPGAVRPNDRGPISQADFTVGSTKEDVLAVQGTPTELSDSVWRYGPSSVLFNGGRVTGWDAEPGLPLEVRMPPSQPVRTTKDYFTVGSTKDQVLAVQGTPTELSDSVWKYGESSVLFSGGRIASWDVEPGSPLKVRMLPSRPVRITKGYFTIGSTKDRVLAVQGTPTEFTDSVWKYGPSSVLFSGDRVTSWYAEPGSPLKVRPTSAGL